MLLFNIILLQWGLTALYVAAEHDYLQIVEELLKRHAEVNNSDKVGKYIQHS